MVETIIRSVFDNLPADWEAVPEEMYVNRYLLFPLSADSTQYKQLRPLFSRANFRVSSIKRVQNPFQHGRYLLRKRMLNVEEEIVYHAVRRIDLPTALQCTCDFRRYARPYFDDIRHYTKDPRFYQTFNSLLHSIGTFEVVRPGELCVLVMNKLKSTTGMSQCDYVINYVVEFNNTM
ncbi:uncharacterized protein LOC126840124 [Adelges cooleyi]|uniref:uncharacterized protein LOC126840124 n=1 Tax=Adelges cooleyi TaxID=133065 RepID=UPI00217F7968|nr:uncharacterized protein LOC126840124 [Adelges cooleyi]